MTETEYRIRIITTCLEYKEYLESELKQAYRDGIVGTYEITKMLMEVNDLISEQSKHFMYHNNKLVTKEELESKIITLKKEDTMNFKRR